jgi:hypothetical protein
MSLPPYWLDDAEQRAARFPDTFEIPPASVRHSLVAGDYAKLMFKPEQDAERGIERMWVCITTVMPDGSYRGWLDNDPTVIRAKHRDTVVFGPENVIQVSKEERTVH